MADEIGWKSVTLKGELAHRASLISISFSGQPSLCDNAPEAVNRGALTKDCFGPFYDIDEYGQTRAQQRPVDQQGGTTAQGRDGLL